MKLRILAPDSIPWDRLDAYADRNVFQTRHWMEFLAAAERAQPVVAEVLEGRELAGYFSGFLFQRYGIRMLGSPFPGWTTPYMGFNLEPGVSRAAALQALEDAAFGELKCLHLEVCDREFREQDGAALGFEFDHYQSYETDLTPPEEELLNRIDKKERWSIRKADKCGIRVEHTCEAGFAQDFYDQLIEVFGKKGLVPTFGLNHVEALIRYMLPSGNLLLLRARSPEGACLATDIFVALNRVAYFWGNASYRFGLPQCPNQPLHWHAMRYFKARGIEVFDWGGGGRHKQKFAAVPIAIPRFRKSRYKLLSVLRSEAKRLVRARQRVLAGLRLTFRSGAGRSGCAPPAPCETPTDG